MRGRGNEVAMKGAKEANFRRNLAHATDDTMMKTGMME